MPARCRFRHARALVEKAQRELVRASDILEQGVDDAWEEVIDAAMSLDDVNSSIQRKADEIDETLAVFQEAAPRPPEDPTP